MGSVRRRTSTLLTVPLLLAALVGVSPADAAVVGELWGGADADLLEVSAVSLPPGCGDESGTPIVGEAVDCEFELAQLIVGDTEAGADSDAGITYAGETGLSAFGHASNLDPDALTVGGTEGTLSAQLLVESNAIQPGGETSDSDQLVSLPANPVLGLDVATTEATALDVSDGNSSCPSVDAGRAVIASGRNELLGLVVGPGTVGGGDLLATQDPEQVSYAESRIDLVDALVGGAADGVYGMASTATVQLAPIVPLGGEIVVEIATPVLTVAHDGQGAEVTYETPLVTINGETVADGETIEFLDALDLPGNPLLNLTVGIADADDVTIDGETATVSDVVTLDIVLGDPETDMALGVASLSIGDLNAAAFVGPDGVSIDGCGTSDDPLSEVSKDVTATVVAPGETFDYVITVPNRGACTLTDVVVTDTVTGPDGFEIVATEPEATVDGDTLTWEVGELEPNETVSFTITVRAPDDASEGDMFRDVVDVTGTCDGEDVEGGDTLDLPGIFTPTNPGCDVSDSNKAATHVEVTPGQTFSYLIHAFNSGGADCGATTVTDELEDGVDFVSCNADCTATGSTVTWQLAELAAGASRTLVVTVAVNDDAVVGERLPNAAVIDPTDGSSVTVSTEGPLLDDASILAPPDPAAPAGGRTPAGEPDGGSAPPPAPAPTPSLPATGGGAALGGLVSLALAGALRRRLV